MRHYYCLTVPLLLILQYCGNATAFVPVVTPAKRVMSLLHVKNSQRTTPTTKDSNKDAPALSFLSLNDTSTLVPYFQQQEQQIAADFGSSNQPVSIDEIQQQQKTLMLGLLWIIALLSALDRVAMSVAVIPMSQELGWTDSVKGSISSFFSIGYGIAILPAGLILSQASPKIVMAAGLLLWSLATIVTPLVIVTQNNDAAQLLWPLLLARAAVGAAESVVLPTLQRFLSTWTTAEEKSVVLALMFSGFQTGTILAYLLSPWVMDVTDGWRGLFVTYGGIGLLALVPWLLLARDSPTRIGSDGTIIDTVATSSNKFSIPLMTKQQQEQTASQLTTTQSSSALQDSLNTIKHAPWKDFLSSPGVWGMLLAHAAKNWGLYNQLSWFPTFYSEQYHVGVRDSSFAAILPSVAAVVGGLIAGNLADAIIRNGSKDVERLTNIRKGFQTFGMLGSAGTLAYLAYNIPTDPNTAQALLTATVGLSAFNAAGFEAGIQEKSGEKWAGLLYSVTTLPCVMIGTLGVYLTGRLLDATNQDWSIVFGLNSFVYVLGALAFLILYDSKREFD